MANIIRLFMIQKLSKPDSKGVLPEKIGELNIKVSTDFAPDGTSYDFSPQRPQGI